MIGKVGERRSGRFGRTNFANLGCWLNPSHGFGVQWLAWPLWDHNAFWVWNCVLGCSIDRLRCSIWLNARLRNSLLPFCLIKPRPNFPSLAVWLNLIVFLSLCLLENLHFPSVPPPPHTTMSLTYGYEMGKMSPLPASPKTSSHP